MQRDELWLAFQPMWRLGDHDAIGAEALVRWDHPTRGVLLPGAFLSTPGQFDLILAVGEVVLTRACEQLAVWQEVLADQVGSAQVLATVQHLGCDPGQGYHLGRSVPAEGLWLPRAADPAEPPPDGADPSSPAPQPDRQDAAAVGSAATR